MKKTNKVLGFAVIAAITLAALFAFSTTACSGSGGGGKSLNSATELKEYLDKQPANSPDQPIKVAMKANEMMIKDIAKVISEAGKYVNLNLSGSPLTEIPKDAFRDCKTLVGVTIPNSVTSIGSGAFSGTGLTSITIPNSVTSIEGGAFPDSLTSITIDSGNPNFTVEGGILYSKTEIVYVPKGISGNVTIPNGVTRIKAYAFYERTGLTGITIPSSVTSIGGSAFMSCSSLTSVTIPNSVTTIERDAFIVCISLTSVTFQGTIAYNKFGDYNAWGEPLSPFSGDLHAKYFASTGGIGTYTRPNGESRTWTKQ